MFVIMSENNLIELKVGDVFRFNRSRKHHKVIHMFDYKGKTFVVILGDTDYSHFEIMEKNRLCGVRNYPGSFEGIVEVNGSKVRGTGGKLLSVPKKLE